MSEQSYGLQESPTTVKHLVWVNVLGVVFALAFYFYKTHEQPVKFPETLANAALEPNILGACLYAFLLILSLMTGKILSRYSIVSIKQSKYLVSAVQVLLAGFMMFHLGIIGYLIFYR